MIKPFLDFQWWIDPKGYRIAGAEPLKRRELEFKKKYPRNFELEPFRSYRKLGRIVPVSGERKSLRPLEQPGVDGRLAIMFANTATSPNGALNFIKCYGPLTDLGFKQTLGEPISAVIEQANAMKNLTTYSDRGRKHAGALIGPHLMRFSFVLDPLTGDPRLRYSAEDLLGALWLELSQFLLGGGTLKICKCCGELFAAGPGARRLDSEFCSPAHHRKFHNQFRGKKKSGDV